MGGRFQWPLSKGEMALSYHHRVANSEGLSFVKEITIIPEDRLALDGKWDIGSWTLV